MIFRADLERSLTAEEVDSNFQGIEDNRDISDFMNRRNLAINSATIIKSEVVLDDSYSSASFTLADVSIDIGLSYLVEVEILSKKTGYAKYKQLVIFKEDPNDDTKIVNDTDKAKSSCSVDGALVFAETYFNENGLYIGLTTSWDDAIIDIEATFYDLNSDDIIVRYND